jgi:arylsulfatase A-like enzyme
VVFISDNGGPSVAPISNGSVNAPLRGQKTTVLEGGIRVPFIFKWPSRLPAGEKSEALVSALDIFPSFLEAGGGNASEIDDCEGVNIIPFLTGQTDRIPHESLEWRYTVGTAIREGDWKLIQLPDRLPMLYHITEDVSEQNDLALENLDRTGAMLNRLGTWEVHLPHPLFHEPADWRIRHLGFYDAAYQLVQPE